MKFMITWVSDSEKRHDVYKTFAQMTDADDEADRGGVQLIGRWHDVGAGKGVAICESNDLAAVHSWIFNWNNALDLEITPVVDDDECKAIVKRKFGLG